MATSKRKTSSIHFTPKRATKCHRRLYVVIIPILGTKLIGTRYCVDADTKLIAWCTATQDVFKFIPMSNLLNKASWQLRRRLMNFTDRSQGKRISSCLNDASRLKGVVFMDLHNADMSCQIFGPIDSPIILPICTAEPDLEPRNPPPTIKRGFSSSEIRPTDHA